MALVDFRDENFRLNSADSSPPCPLLFHSQSANNKVPITYLQSANNKMPITYLQSTRELRLRPLPSWLVAALGILAGPTPTMRPPPGPSGRSLQCSPQKNHLVMRLHDKEGRRGLGLQVWGPPHRASVGSPNSELNCNSEHPRRRRRCSSSGFSILIKYSELSLWGPWSAVRAQRRPPAT